MEWNQLTDVSQLSAIDKESAVMPAFILKHSTRCSISSMALNRIESNWKDEYHEKIKPYYLDLIRFRDISNAIAEKYQVIHESPQVLIITNGKCVYTESHGGIRLQEILAQI